MWLLQLTRQWLWCLFWYLKVIARFPSSVKGHGSFCILLSSRNISIYVDMHWWNWSTSSQEVSEFKLTQHSQVAYLESLLTTKWQMTKWKWKIETNILGREQIWSMAYLTNKIKWWSNKESKFLSAASSLCNKMHWGPLCPAALWSLGLSWHSHRFIFIIQILQIDQSSPTLLLVS